MSIFKQRTSPKVLLTELNTNSFHYLIFVNILKIWNGYKTLEAVLVDEEGTRIHATIGEDLKSRFYDKLVEGQAITVDTFKVADYSGGYRSSDLPYKINFYRTTTISECSDFPAHVPERYLKSFTDILNKNFNENVLFDVIGQIVHYEHLQELIAKGRKTARLNIDLKDQSGKQISCTLWGEYANQVYGVVNANPSARAICLEKLMCLREYQGRVTISNSFNSTKILMNPDTPHIKELLTSLNGISTNGSSDENIGSDGASLATLHEEFFDSTIPRLTIRDINKNAKTGAYITTAIIESLGKNQWYYIACRDCNRIVEPYPGSSTADKDAIFYCDHCKEDVSTVDARYRLVLRVKNKANESANILFFDTVAQQLLGLTANEVVEEVIDKDPSVIPSSINDMFGKSILLKIIKSKDNLQSPTLAYVVDRFSIDTDMILEYKTTFPTENGVNDTKESSRKRKQETSIEDTETNKETSVGDSDTKKESSIGDKDTKKEVNKRRAKKEKPITT